MPDIVTAVSVQVKHISRGGIIYLTSSRFLRDIELRPQQLAAAELASHRIRKRDRLVIDVRVANDGKLHTSRVLSLNGMLARPPGPRRRTV